MAYNIAIIGTGYVGLVSGTTFAASGNNVICVDIDEKKIEKLSKGIPTIYEPGLDYYLQNNIKEERIKFTSDIEYSVLNSQIIFLCLPTPPNEDGSADLHHVLNCAENIAEIFKKNNNTDPKIIVNKSTVPVGTGERVKSIFANLIPEQNIEIVSNPEFLREGYAVEDALKPERVVIGTGNSETAELMKDLYSPFVRSGNPIHIVDIKSAEVIKYASNSFLAVKISFMNDLSKYCETVGADIEKIRIGMGSDSRIGKRFLFAGLGYGGSCFPKDVKALVYSGEEHGIDLKIIKAAQDVNHIQIERFADSVINRFGGDLNGKTVAIWGLAFKPNTDDTREAPAFKIIDKFLSKNAVINAYDPEALENTKVRFGDSINYFENMYKCINNADFIVICTEWSIFRQPDFDKIKQCINTNVIFDGRNLFEPKSMAELGFEYHCIGREYIAPIL